MHEIDGKRFRIAPQDNNFRYFDSFVSAAEHARQLVDVGANEVAVEEREQGEWRLRDRYLTRRPDKD